MKLWHLLIETFELDITILARREKNGKKTANSFAQHFLSSVCTMTFAAKNMV